jgi:hypothetical protein
MQLPTFFVEYLISGACALIWIWEILIVKGIVNGPPSADKVDAGYVALLIPILYVLGMFIDFIGRWCVKKIIKEKVVNRWRSDSTDLSDTADNMSATLAVHAPEANKELGMRSSRDRVARGALVNLMITVFIFIFWFNRINQTLSLNLSFYSVLFSGLALVALCFLVWNHFDERTSKYQKAAFEVAVYKLNNTAEIQPISTSSSQPTGVSEKK